MVKGDYKGSMECHVAHVKSLYHVQAAVDFLHLAVYMPQIFLLAAEKFLRFLHHNHNQKGGNRQDHQCDQRHQRTDGQHHNQHADHGGDGSDQRRDALIQALSQRIHIVGDAGEYLAVGAGLKIVHGHTADFLGNLPAELIADLLRHPAHNPALYEGKDRAENIHAQEQQKNLSHLCKINPAQSLYLFRQARKQFVGCAAQNLGTQNIKYGASHRKHNHKDQTDAVRLHHL